MSDKPAALGAALIQLCQQFQLIPAHLCGYRLEPNKCQFPAWAVTTPLLWLGATFITSAIAVLSSSSEISCCCCQRWQMGSCLLLPASPGAPGLGSQGEQQKHHIKPVQPSHMNLMWISSLISNWSCQWHWKKQEKTHCPLFQPPQTLIPALCGPELGV